MASVETVSQPGPSPVSAPHQGCLDAQSALSPLGLPRPGPGASAHEHAFWRAATDPDYFAWLEHVRLAAGCAHPIRLVGELTTVNNTTGEPISRTSTNGMPDGAIYKPCGNRRHTVCPSCAETYRRNAYQVIRAGMVGGKGVPDSVAEHPAVFGDIHRARLRPSAHPPRHSPYLPPSPQLRLPPRTVSRPP
jgi:hypothetical protein